MNMYPGGYYHHYGSADIMDGAFGVVMGIYLVFMLFALALSVVVYVLESVSFYTIAKRRGIRNPWLSWLPVGNLWIVGSISDQYQYVKHGKVKNRRKILLGLNLGYLGITAIYMLLAFVQGFLAGATGSGVAGGMMIMWSLLFMLAMVAISITMTVFLYIALYDLYASCDPSNAVLYLLLSIFVSVTMPFFLFACRKKDGGMPPRRDAIPQQPATPQPHPDWVSSHRPAAPQSYPGWTPDQRPIVFPTDHPPVVPQNEETVVLTPEPAPETSTVFVPEESGSTATLPEETEE